MSELKADRVPGRGAAADAAEFRSALDELGLGKADLVRFMMRNGDDRAPTTIDRGIHRIAIGETRLSGEMRVVLTMLRNSRAKAAGREVDGAD